LKTEVETMTVYQKQCTWVEGYAWQPEEGPDRNVFLDERDLDEIRELHQERAEIGREAGYVSAETGEEEPVPTEHAREYTSYGASDGSCYPAKGSALRSRGSLQ